MRSILPQILFLCGLVLVGILIFASLAKEKTEHHNEDQDTDTHSVARRG